MTFRFFCLWLIFQLLKALAGAEDQRDTPNACQGNDGVDDTAEQRGLSAADPSYNVKLEQTDATPVQSAQDGKNQRNAIHNHSKTPTPFQAVSFLKKTLLSAFSMCQGQKNYKWKKLKNESRWHTMNMWFFVFTSGSL